MKRSIMKRWVKALRSGEYEQTKDKLVSEDDSFCCLGVLCNLSVDDGVGEWRHDHILGRWFFQCNEYFDFKDAMELPESVREWAGMNSCDGAIRTDISPYSLIYPPTLAELNDNGKSFKEIADIIEKNYKDL